MHESVQSMKHHQQKNSTPSHRTNMCLLISTALFLRQMDAVFWGGYKTLGENILLYRCLEQTLLRSSTKILNKDGYGNV